MTRGPRGAGGGSGIASTIIAWGARLARSAIGAAAFGLVAACLDAGWAGAGLGEQAPGKLDLLLADAGLMAPAALFAGVLGGLAAIAADPGHPPSPATLIGSLRLRAVGRPADIAAFVPLVVLASFFWMTLSAHLARAILALDAPAPLVGIAVAAAALGLGLIVALAVLALTPRLRRTLATASDGRPACVDPAVTGAVALAVAACLFAFGVETGGVSGEGGLFGIYGIFKRPELDLRAPALLLLIALAAFLAQATLRNVRASVALLGAALSLALTARAATALNVETAVSQAIERGAPIAGKALLLLRRATDRDRDGASALFGGGDCDDRDPRVNPLATEILDNGVDDDCSGGDLTAAALAKLDAGAQRGKPAVDPHLPADLNLVLITIDTLRSDLGYAGNPRPLSPNLDALAARSTVFERAYSLASYTGKSVGPMLIGKYGSETHRNWGHFNRFSDEDTFVAERLQRAGVHTMSVQGHHYFGKFGGIDRGFDVLDLSAAPQADTSAWDVDNVATSPALTDAALALLASPEHSGKRFFLWVHYLDPHADYLKHADVPSFGTSQRDMYDGEIAFTDKHIGRLLDAAAQAPWGKRTAVVVTSDHGEAFGEHGMVRHGFELWEPLVRVPLIVHVPGAPPSRVTARRSLIDVTPTILDLMGVPAPRPDAAGDDFLSGVSLLPDALLPAGEPAPARDVLVDMPAGPYNDARRAFIHGDLKLTISNGTRRELYDLAADPEEKKDLWRTPAAGEIAPFYEAQKARLREIQVTAPRK